MQNRFDELVIFGDSYSTVDFCVPWRQSFWGLAAHQLDIPRVINFSNPGHSLDMITHLVISNRYKLHSRSLVLICVPPLERITWHDMQTSTGSKSAHIDRDGNISWQDVPATVGLVNDPVHSVSPDLVRVLERSWTEHQGLLQMFLLSTFMLASHVPFVIMNMCSPFVRYPGWPSNDLCDWFDELPNSIVFENTYAGINHGVNPPVDFDLYGWQGHHGPQGNAKFFSESLWPVIERCYIDCGGDSA